MYVCDFYENRISHVDPRDNWDKSNGRLYRIAHKDAPKLPRPDLEKMSGVELVHVSGRLTEDWIAHNVESYR